MSDRVPPSATLSAAPAATLRAAPAATLSLASTATSTAATGTSTAADLGPAPTTAPAAAVAPASRRYALVTGASSGIGRAAAELLLQRGWSVTCLVRRSAAPDGANVILGDAADPADVLRAVERAAGPDGRLDGLVCAAGIPPSGPWDDTEHWEGVLRIDLEAPFHAARLAWPALRSAGGSVVLVGSVVGAAEGSLRSPAYAAAKAGLEGLARSLAVIGGPDGIRVNVVAPGAIDTPFDVATFAPDARPDVPLGRMGTADEVATIIVMLLSAESSYVTGAVWRVDGGRTVLSPAAAAQRGRAHDPERP